MAEVLQITSNYVTAGRTTYDLAKVAEKEIVKRGAIPSFLGYQGFPSALCTSVNDAVVHGIPSTKVVLREGDIIGLDLGVTYQNMIVDGACTVPVGSISEDRQKLLATTERSLNEGLSQIKEGCTVGDIGSAIEVVLKKDNYGIVRDLVGHGVGHQVHEDPNIPNYGKKGSGERLLTGMTIAVEPMATLGGEKIYIDTDGWTVRTSDGSVSAHFEHTVLITENGHEILAIAT